MGRRRCSTWHPAWRSGTPSRKVTYLGVPLSGRRVRLRAVVASDYDFLFMLAADERTGPHWRYRGLPPRPEEFVRDLWQGVLVQFLVERIDTKERVGLVVAYEANLRDAHCHLGALFRADTRVWPLEAMVLFVNFLSRNSASSRSTAM
jgi:hypothetical protein